MSKRSKREKTIKFFIVEGLSDKKSMMRALENMFPDYKVIVHYYRGDLTSDKNTNLRNLEERIWEQTDYYREKYKVDEADFDEIIQVVDTDGAYIEDRHCVFENSARTRKKNGKDQFFYDVSEGLIRAQHKQHIIDRNYRKREVLDRLVETKSIHGIPYRIFYMSCNLDHVLHNEPNADETFKKTMSNKFALKYENDPNGFKKLFTKYDYCKTGDYVASWNYIRDRWHERRSLERHTNFGIALQQEADDRIKLR